jgi:hypothetical protein
MLSLPGATTWTRSLSRSPSRTSDKPRPWCPRYFDRSHVILSYSIL